LEEHLGHDPEEQRLCLSGGLSLPCDSEMLGSLTDEDSFDLVLVRIGPERAKMLKDLKSKRRSMKNMPDEAWSDLELILAAVRAGDRFAIQQATAMLIQGALEANVDLAVELVSSDGNAYHNLSDALKLDSKVALSAVCQHAELIKDIPSTFAGDQSFVLQAVSKRGSILQHLPQSFRHDRDVVLAAVRSEGRAIRVAGPRLKKDKEVLLTASANDASVLSFLDLDVL